MPHRSSEWNCPAVHMEHGYCEQNRLTRIDVVTITRARGPGLQNNRSMTLHNTLGIAGSARGVAERRSAPLV